MGGHSVVASLLARFGTAEQRAAYLPRLATGEIRATMALTEPDGGSDLQAMRTVARRDGDYFVLNGTKMWITNARRAGLIAVLCKTDPSAAPPHRGMSVLLVEPGPGLTVSRDLPKLGYKGVETCEIAFEVPGAFLSACWAGRPAGLRPDDERTGAGRIQVAARATGVGAGGVRGVAGRTRSRARRSGCRSGSTSRSATTWPTWP